MAYTEPFVPQGKLREGEAIPMMHLEIASSQTTLLAMTQWCLLTRMEVLCREAELTP